MKLRLIAGAVMAASVVTIGATPAFAGSLHYYNNNSYGAKIGSFTCDTNKVMHDVADDVINSVKNETSCNFSARSWDWIPNTTIQVAYISKNQNYSTFGDRNNQIDHFDRR